MRLLFIYLLLLPALTWGQNKPLADAVEQARLKARATNKAANTLNDLFTPNGIDKAAPTAQSPNQLIYKLTLNPMALAQIKQERRELLEISVPTANGPVELAVVPTNIFAPGFTVKTSAPDPNFTFDASRYQFYQGILKNNPNSMVTLMLTNDEVRGTISDSTGNRVLARKRDKAASTTDYAIYNEKAVMTETRPFSCGTVDDVVSSSPASGSSVGNVPIDKANSSCVKYVGVYFEADYEMYQDWNQDENSLTDDILFLFSQVATIYYNDGMYVKLAGKKIWNIPDPYLSAADNTSDVLQAFKSSWNSSGNNFPGQVAQLLSSRNLGGGKSAGFNGLFDRSTAYVVSGGIYYYRTISPYPTYSWPVSVATHELGHNFGSSHTHWCGWDGGAIDNCNLLQTQANIPNEGPCGAGPTPTNGGTIMSYCHLVSSVGINFINGFGPQPSNLIQTNIARTSLPITTIDGIISSVTSGGWSAASTWACGIAVGVSHDASISSGNTVQINFTESAKSLDIRGILNLSTSSSIININN